jgi:hypothetical protein
MAVVLRSPKRRRLDTEDAESVAIYRIPVEIWVEILRKRVRDWLREGGVFVPLSPKDIYRFGLACFHFHRVALLAVDWTPICKAVPSESMDVIVKRICPKCRVVCKTPSCNSCYRCDVSATFISFIKEMKDPKHYTKLFDGYGLDLLFEFLSQNQGRFGDRGFDIYSKWYDKSYGDFGSMPLLNLYTDHIPRICQGECDACYAYSPAQWMHPVKWKRTCEGCNKNLMTECIACFFSNSNGGASIVNERTVGNYSISCRECGTNTNLARAASRTDSCACPQYTWEFLLDTPISCGLCQKPFKDSTVCIFHSTCLKCMQLYCRDCLEVWTPQSQIPLPGLFEEYIAMGFCTQFCSRCVVSLTEYPIYSGDIYNSGVAESMTWNEKDHYCIQQLYLEIPW